MLRFAPSPTGYLHTGNARVAVLNYLYAKHKELEFFLRIDDTDQERSDEKFVDAIIEDLSWLGITFDRIIKQSDRTRDYKDTFEFLKNKEFIYPCFETSDELALKRKVQLKLGKPPIYDRSALKLTKNEISKFISSGKNPHWRLKLDDDPISWDDQVHGKISFDHLSISDPVVFRSDEMPLFTITSVVDDSEFNVSHILRGDDHITNTAAQIKLFKYLDSPIPKFGHFPLMRSKTGGGLSKRSNSFSLREFKEKKITPLVLMNYLNKIGTSSSIDELQSVDDLIKKFELSIFSKNSVLFDLDDLTRLNSKYIKNVNYSELKKNINVEFDEKFWDIIKSNVSSYDEANEWFDIIKGINKNTEKIKVDSFFFENICNNLPSEITKQSWNEWTKKIKEAVNIKPKDIYVTLRIILTGKNYGPSMNELLTLFTREEILKRIIANCEKTTNKDI